MAFGDYRDTFSAWDELNGQEGFQPEADYMRYIRGFGRKKLSDRKVGDYQNRVAALIASGWAPGTEWERAPGKQNINSIVGQIIRDEYNQLPGEVRARYPKLKAIHDIYRRVKEEELGGFLTRHQIADPGTDELRRKLSKKVFSSQEWAAELSQMIPHGQTLITELMALAGRAAGTA
jgi:hypothetical protein